MDPQRPSSPTLLHWREPPTDRPGCSEPHPAWPWASPGRGCPLPLMVTCSSASLPVIVKPFFLISSPNHHSSSLKPFLLVLSQQTLLKSLSPSFLQLPYRYWNAAIRSPQSFLFSRPNSPQDAHKKLRSRHLFRLLLTGSASSHWDVHKSLKHLCSSSVLCRDRGWCLLVKAPCAGAACIGMNYSGSALTRWCW